MTKKSAVFSAIITCMLIGILASRPPEGEKPKYKNLKVLSRKITEDQMDSVMESICVGLGVNCMFCHVPGDRLAKVLDIDFVTDSLENKRVARDMMRMTLRLNRKYFNTAVNTRMTVLGRISCRTCHGGKPIPLFPYHKK